MSIAQTFDERCRKDGGILQWASDGILTTCAKPRADFADETVILYEEKSDLPILKDNDPKSRYVYYFTTVYPSTSAGLWNKLPLESLKQIYQNLEILYDIPNKPGDKLPVRAAFKPFYRIPEGVDLQQDVDHKEYPSNTYVEVFHAGNMNTDFYIPNELFAGTFYYPARGSGVFLPIGNSLVALNKVDALKKLKVPNEVIAAHSGKAFKRWLTKAETELKKQYPTKPEEEIKKLALDYQIDQMVKGKNSTLSRGETCYYGLGSEGDSLLAWAAIQEGYDTIQLIREGQLGCDKNGLLQGFELIHLLNPDNSAQELRMAVPDDYVDSHHGPAGFYKPKDECPNVPRRNRGIKR